MREIPIYLFSGFLEAGKTTMIRQALADPDFSSGERTLVLLCEEGIEEYDPTEFASENTWVEVIDSEEDLNPAVLSAFEKKYGIERVIAEYNGMWQLAAFFRALPENWMVYQEIFAADSETILNYNANMRSLVVDKLQSCDLVVFNRITDATDKMPLHKLVRGISRRANIEYDYTDGRAEADDIEDPLPFDLNADVIDIADNDYALWYQDLMEDMYDIDSAPDSEANTRQTIATAAEKTRCLFIRRKLYHTQPPIHAFYAQRMTIDLVVFDYPYLATDLLPR